MHFLINVTFRMLLNMHQFLKVTFTRGYLPRAINNKNDTKPEIIRNAYFKLWWFEKVFS